MWVQLSTTCSNVLKQPNGEPLVTVNHNQLRTMASETVDPIVWSHPPPSWAVPPEHHVHSINQCNLSGTRTCNRSMRGMQPPCLCGHSRYKHHSMSIIYSLFVLYAIFQLFNYGVPRLSMGKKIYNPLLRCNV